MSNQPRLNAKSFDHVTLICADLEATRRFYVDFIGMTEVPRPAFKFPGLLVSTRQRADSCHTSKPRSGQSRLGRSREHDCFTRPPHRIRCRQCRRHVKDRRAPRRAYRLSLATTPRRFQAALSLRPRRPRHRARFCLIPDHVTRRNRTTRKQIQTIVATRNPAASSQIEEESLAGCDVFASTTSKWIPNKNTA